jgi:hypothetical protein
MALTESKIKELRDKKFDTLYEEHKAEWTKLAKTAYVYVKQNITGGNEPRPDDVAGVLLPVLKPHDEVRKHQDDKSARASRYVLMFTEYVIDQSLYQGGEK